MSDFEFAGKTFGPPLKLTGEAARHGTAFFLWQQNLEFCERAIAMAAMQVSLALKEQFPDLNTDRPFALAVDDKGEIQLHWRLDNEKHSGPDVPLHTGSKDGHPQDVRSDSAGDADFYDKDYYDIVDSFRRRIAARKGKA